MSSACSVYVGNQEILYHQNGWWGPLWFKKSDRQIQRVTHKCPDGSALESKEYIFLADGGAVRRRLSAEGHDEESLQQEFLETREELLAEMRQYVLDNPEIYELPIKIVSESSLHDWISAFRTIDSGSIRRDIYSREKVDYGSPLANLIAQPDLYLSRYQTAATNLFPCRSFEAYALAWIMALGDNVICKIGRAHV